MRIPTPCPQWADALAARAPEDLSPSQRAALTRHLVSCQRCTQALEDYDRLTARIRAGTQDDRLLILNHQLKRLRGDMRVLGMSERPALARGAARARSTRNVEGLLPVSAETRLHYQVLGSGAHPLLVPALHWPLARCEKLLSRHTLVFYDRHQRQVSTEPVPAVSALLGELEALCHHLDLAHVALLGWSRFGEIAAHYAREHREQVSRLILIRPVPRLSLHRGQGEHALVESQRSGLPETSCCSVPTLIIHGGNDPLPVSSSRLWATALPNARLLTMQGAGPAPWDDTPRAFFAAVTQFLAGAWPQKAVCIDSRSA